MRRVEAVMRSPELRTFIELAPSLGIEEFEVSDLRRTPSAGERPRQCLYRGQEFTLNLLPRSKVGFVLFENEVHETIHRLMENVQVDGVAVFKLEEAIPNPLPRQRGAVGDNRRSPNGQSHRELH